MLSLVTTDHLVVTIITGFKRSNNEQIKQNPQCLLCLVSHPLQENPHNPHHNGYQWNGKHRSADAGWLWSSCQVFIPTKKMKFFIKKIICLEYRLKPSKNRRDLKKNCDTLPLSLHHHQGSPSHFWVPYVPCGLCQGEGDLGGTPHDQKLYQRVRIICCEHVVLLYAIVVLGHLWVSM